LSDIFQTVYEYQVHVHDIDLFFVDVLGIMWFRSVYK